LLVHHSGGRPVEATQALDGFPSMKTAPRYLCAITLPLKML
jgi:hypothetical protein